MIFDSCCQMALTELDSFQAVSCLTQLRLSWGEPSMMTWQRSHSSLGFLVASSEEAGMTGGRQFGTAGLYRGLDQTAVSV